MIKVLKKISPIIICAFIAFTICVSAVSFGADVNIEPPEKTTVNMISVEKYLIALYEAVHNAELTDETDFSEVMVWAETNAILENIADDTQDISEIPLTQETALIMLSRSYTELAEITDMITEVSHTVNNRLPQRGMPEQSKEYITNMGNTENAEQPFLPNNGGFSGDRQQLQMPKTEIPDDTQSASQTTAEISGIAKNQQMSTPDFAVQSKDNTVSVTSNIQASPQNGTFAGGRPASNMQMPLENNLKQDNSQSNSDARSKTKQDRNVPSGEKSTNNQKNALPPGNTKTESSDSQSNVSELFDVINKETQMTENLEEQASNVSLSEHIKEYQTTYIGLLVLAAAFVFVKLFRHRRY